MKNPPKSQQAGYPQPLQDRIAEIDYLRCLTYGWDAMPLMLPRAERVKDDRDSNDRISDKTNSRNSISTVDAAKRRGPD